MPALNHFSASYDRTTKLISAVVCAFLLLIALLLQQVMFGFVSVLILGLAYAYSPLGYTISEGTIIVRRLIGNVRFPLEDVREARRATSRDLSGAIRLWGNGGLFGYYGLFRTSNLGRCWWYLANRRNIVVVTAASKTALFSPDDVDGFLAAISTWSPVPTGPGEGVRRSQPRGFRTSPAMWIGIGVAVAAAAAMAFAFMYSPGPPACTLTPDTLSIHDRFYPATIKAAEVDVGHIRVVDITSDTSWRPTMRTNGFANSHYRSGWFRVANGQKVRMYRADGTRLVLLPPKAAGAPVLLEVRNPERFVEDVRREWSHP